PPLSDSEFVYFALCMLCTLLANRIWDIYNFYFFLRVYLLFLSYNRYYSNPTLANSSRWTALHRAYSTLYERKLLRQRARHSSCLTNHEAPVHRWTHHFGFQRTRFVWMHGLLCLRPLQGCHRQF